METTQKRNWKKYLWIGVSALVIILSVTIYFKYYFVYSEGTRVGILYKFSNKGTVFKTYEGEMVLPGLKPNAQNLSSNLFKFSVDDDELAKELTNCQGMEVELHYVNYNNALPWRGDSYSEQEGQYVVDKLIRIKNKEPNGYGL